MNEAKMFIYMCLFRSLVWFGLVEWTKKKKNASLLHRFRTVIWCEKKLQQKNIPEDAHTHFYVQIHEHSYIRTVSTRQQWQIFRLDSLDVRVTASYTLIFKSVAT